MILLSEGNEKLYSIYEQLVEPAIKMGRNIKVDEEKC